MTEDGKDLLIGCFNGDRYAQGDFVTRFSDLVYHTVLNTLKAKAVDYQTQDVEDLQATRASLVTAVRDLAERYSDPEKARLFTQRDFEKQDDD